MNPAPFVPAAASAPGRNLPSIDRTEMGTIPDEPTGAAPDERPDDEPRRVPLHRNPFLWAFLVGIATLTAMRPLLRHIPEPPPVFGAVPSFTLTDQDGRGFGKDQLLGRVTIANLFCTQCGSPTTEIIKGMRRIEDAYKDRGIDRIGFLSISTDPRVDTPERLREYARQIGAEGGRWTFLTGDADVVRELASRLFTNGPIVPAGPGDRERASSEDPGGSITRPLVLIDQQARIRGWYGADEMGLDEVYNRAQHVLGPSARPP